jgi:hypothetical protein
MQRRRRVVWLVTLTSVCGGRLCFMSAHHGLQVQPFALSSSSLLLLLWPAFYGLDQ